MGNGATPTRDESAGFEVRNFRQRLQSPYALVGQGFLVGGLFFVATRADAAAILSALF